MNNTCKDNRKLSIVQNTLFNSAGSFFYLLCSWLTTVIVVKLGSVEFAGILSLSMAVTNMFFSVSTFGIRTYQVSDVARKYTADDYVTTRLQTCAGAFVLCAAYTAASGVTRVEAACIMAFMLFKIGESLSDENQALQQIAERMDYICVSFVLRGTLMILTFTGMLYAVKDLRAALLAMAGSTLLVVMLYEFPVSRKLSGFRLKFNPAITRNLLKDSLPLLANSLLMVLMVSIPRTRLNAIWGNYWMGIYGSVAAPAAIVQSAALWVFMPSLGQLAAFWGKKDRKAFVSLDRRMLCLLGGMSALVLLGAVLFGHWGLALIFGEEIAAHGELLLPTLAGTMLIALEYYLSSVLTVMRKLKSIVIANAAGLVLTLALSDVLIRMQGVNGVNSVVCMAMGLNCLMMGAVARRSLGALDADLPGGPGEAAGRLPGPREFLRRLWRKKD